MKWVETIEKGVERSRSTKKEMLCKRMPRVASRAPLHKFVKYNLDGRVRISGENGENPIEFFTPWLESELDFQRP